MNKSLYLPKAFVVEWQHKIWWDLSNMSLSYLDYSVSVSLVKNGFSGNSLRLIEKVPNSRDQEIINMINSVWKHPNVATLKVNSQWGDIWFFHESIFRKIFLPWWDRYIQLRNWNAFKTGVFRFKQENDFGNHFFPIAFCFV